MPRKIINSLNLDNLPSWLHEEDDFPSYSMPVMSLIVVNIPMQMLFLEEPVQMVTLPFCINTYLPAK